MTPTDIDAGLRFCRASGWNQLEADWRCFLDWNPQGCCVAECDGKVVGTVTTLRFNQKFSWISMLLVEPEMRGKGIGTRLLQEALRLLDDLETVRLDATPAGKLVYDKVGFQDEYRLVRLKAPAQARSQIEFPPGVRPLAESDLSRILRLDETVFGADRSPILCRLYRNAPEYAWIFEAAGAIQGFALGRHGFHAEHLGPIVAEDAAAARSLAAASLARHPERPFLIDAPQASLHWLAWLQSAGFRQERPFIRMFRGTNAWPGLPGLQFAITGPEFG